MSDPSIPGWYGKMPSLGDFAQRGLPASFVSRWDQWLAECMLTSRAALGEAWLDAYLSSPLWQFILFPGVIGESSWAGVLMPSVDRVGRYFPLTIAVAVPPGPERLHSEPVAAWFSALEQTAISTLENGVSPEELATRLTQYPFPAPRSGLVEQASHLARVLVSSHPAKLPLPCPQAMPGLLLDTACQLLLREAAGKSLWWSQPGPELSPLLLCHQGLPDPAGFAGMLTP